MKLAFQNSHNFLCFQKIIWKAINITPIFKHGQKKHINYKSWSFQKANKKY